MLVSTVAGQVTMQEIVSQDHNPHPKYLEVVLQADHQILEMAKEVTTVFPRVMVSPDTIPTPQVPGHLIHRDLQEEADFPVPRSTDITKEIPKDIHQDSQGNLS